MLVRFRLLSLLCLVVIACTSCATPVSLRDSWHNPVEGGKRKYDTILVASLLSRDEDRQRCEENIALRLHRRGIVAFTGFEMFPVSGRASWQMLADAVEVSGVECVITIQAVPQFNQAGEDSAAWMRRVSLYPDYWLPEVFPQWSLYPHYGFTSFYDPSPPGSPQLFVQVNLFDVETKRLVWAGKIETTTIDSMPTGNAAVASLLIEFLAEANLI